MGVVDSAHFSSHEKKSYPTFAYTGEHVADIVKKSQLYLSKVDDAHRIEISGEKTYNI
jgi:hypothetical protein